MILYHISEDLHHDGVFLPRVPSCQYDEEDGQIERVCVSESIEGCLSAMPSGGGNLESVLDSQKGYLQIFRIDTDKLQIKNEHILTHETLYKEGRVCDAHLTQEGWITTSFTVPEEDRFIIKLRAWEETIGYLVPHGETIPTEYDETLPFTYLITEPVYQFEQANKGEEVSFYFSSEEETEKMISYVKKQEDLQIGSQNPFELTIHMLKDRNVKDIFLQDYMLQKETKRKECFACIVEKEKN